MGKIFSKPKMPSMPSLPAITDTPITATPITDNASDITNPPAGTGGSAQDDTPEITPDEQRVQSILTRKRGRVGTIITSYNGVLADAISTLPARKTLLGE